MVKSGIIEEIDIYSTARVLMDQFGENAILEAMMRLERYRKVGNMNGMAVWRRIADAIEFFHIPAQLTSKTVH